MIYEIKFHKAVKKDIKKLHKAVEKVLREKHLSELRKNPYQANPLSSIFKGLWSYHFRHAKVDYRIIYEIQEETKKKL